MKISGNPMEGMQTDFGIKLEELRTSLLKDYLETTFTKETVESMDGNKCYHTILPLIDDILKHNPNHYTALAVSTVVGIHLHTPQTMDWNQFNLLISHLLLDYNVRLKHTNHIEESKKNYLVYEIKEVMELYKSRCKDSYLAPYTLASNLFGYYFSKSLIVQEVALECLNALEENLILYPIYTESRINEYNYKITEILKTPIPIELVDKYAEMIGIKYRGKISTDKVKVSELIAEGIKETGNGTEECKKYIKERYNRQTTNLDLAETTFYHYLVPVYLAFAEVAFDAQTPTIIAKSLHESLKQHGEESKAKTVTIKQALSTMCLAYTALTNNKSSDVVIFFKCLLQMGIPHLLNQLEVNTTCQSQLLH